MASHYRVRVAYKGTNFHGWQAQSSEPETDVLPSVQGTIHMMLRRIARGGACSVSGTSRTDAGVHAQGQLAKLLLPRELPAEVLMRGLNSMLPAAIRILACEPCPSAWNPKSAPSTKEYHYYFSVREVLSPLIADVVAHVPGPIDHGAIVSAAELFVGTHDFHSYARRSGNAATTTRTLEACELITVPAGPLMDGVSILRVVGNGFLKHMVRYLASALFAVARGERSAVELREQLAKHTDEKLAPKAPAHGLHLVAIRER